MATTTYVIEGMAQQADQEAQWYDAEGGRGQPGVPARRGVRDLVDQQRRAAEQHRDRTGSQHPLRQPPRADRAAAKRSDDDRLERYGGVRLAVLGMLATQALLEKEPSG